MKDLWEFNPQTETWSQKANFSGTARRQAVCFTAANKAYVGTGEDATGLKKDVYAYDPNLNAWNQVADFSGTARRDAVAFELNGFGFNIEVNDWLETSEYQDGFDLADVYLANFYTTSDG